MGVVVGSWARPKIACRRCQLALLAFGIAGTTPVTGACSPMTANPKDAGRSGFNRWAADNRV